MPRRRKYATDEEREAARREQTNASHRRKREEIGRSTYRAHEHNRGVRPDPSILAAHEEWLQNVYASELTIDQLILGDPLPGRSALEAKGHELPPRTADAD